MQKAKKQNERKTGVPLAQPCRGGRFCFWAYSGAAKPTGLWYVRKIFENP